MAPLKRPLRRAPQGSTLQSARRARLEGRMVGSAMASHRITGGWYQTHSCSLKDAHYPGIDIIMSAVSSIQRRRELGDFIRAQRERVTPAAVGLVAARRRRTPGLRREEVAELSGLSTTWYTWVEQGRDVSMSPGALARLAQALRLGRAQRQYLFELAGRRDPDPGAGGIDELPPAVSACVATIDAPAYILD